MLYKLYVYIYNICIIIFIYLFSYICIYLFILFIYLFIYSFIRLFVHLVFIYLLYVLCIFVVIILFVHLTLHIYIYTMREQESMAVLIAKIGAIFVPGTLPHRRILFQRSLQRPQACSLLWPGPHRHAVYYDRDRTGTLITMAGTAPGPR